MLNTEIFTHMAITYNNDQIPITKEVKDDFEDRNIPESHVFIVGENSVRKSAIKQIKKMPSSGARKKDQYQRINYEKEWNKQKKRADEWIANHPEEWEEALDIAESWVKEQNFIELPKSKMFKNVIESKARILCGIEIKAS